jgi:DNA end-binding protein Ku
MKTKTTNEDSDSHPHGRMGLWSGSISFGLVNIPVRIISSKESESLHFTMLDPTNMSPIGYKYYNKISGKDVTRSKTVKGYEYKKNTYVLLSDADFLKANPKATQTVDIEDFVDAEAIQPIYFNKSYFLAPMKSGIKGYALLRDALKKSGRAAIARLVMHNKQNLVCIMPQDQFLILETLHFADEVKDLRELKDVQRQIESAKTNDKELKMAENLVEDMYTAWNPEKYKDTYHNDLMKMIETKYKSGKAKELSDVPPSEGKSDSSSSSKVIDLMPLLKKSLDSVHTRKKSRTSKVAREGSHR